MQKEQRYAQSTPPGPEFVGPGSHLALAVFMVDPNDALVVDPAHIVESLSGLLVGLLKDGRYVSRAGLLQGHHYYLLPFSGLLCRIISTPGFFF